MRLSDPSSDDRQHLGSLVVAPFVDLAARVARFEAPFEYLKGSKVGFRPASRYLLNRCIAGDEDAIAAREDGIFYHIPVVLLDDVAAVTEASERYRSYMRAHQGEIQDLMRSEYLQYDATSIEKPKDLNTTIDAIVLTSMAEYGFSAKTRKATKGQWRCSSGSFGESVDIYFDKGAGSMSAYLDVDQLPYFADLAAPFFFAQVEYRYVEEVPIEHQLQAFFAEYARLFPHVIEAIERATPIRDAYLRGDRDRAYELARQSLGLGV